MSDRRGDFVRAYEETDAALSSQRPSAKVDRRFEETLARRTSGGITLAPIGGVVIALGVVAAVLALGHEGRDRQPDSRRVVAVAPAEAPLPPVEIVEASTKTLEAEHVVVAAVRPLELRRESGALRIVDGSARFVVEKMARAEPLRLSVMNAYIEVTGTTFFLDATPTGGYVELEEGRIAFVAADGARTELAPGDVHRWGDVAGRWPDVQIDAAVADVSALRAEARYAEAERRIDVLLRAPIGRRAAEVLSFERGTLLDTKLDRHDDACRHWRRHRARFAPGHYDDVVAAALDSCARGNSKGGDR